jgi:hypothetical protein
MYYFSPQAAEIAIAGNLFRGFHARVCSKKPELGPASGKVRELGTVWTVSKRSRRIV